MRLVSPRVCPRVCGLLTCASPIPGRVSREAGNNPAYGVAATVKKVAVLESVNFGDVSQSTTSAEDNTVSSATLDTRQ